MFIRLDSIHERDRQTHGQTLAHCMTAKAALASCSKNCQKRSAVGVVWLNTVSDLHIGSELSTWTFKWPGRTHRDSFAPQQCPLFDHTNTRSITATRGVLTLTDSRGGQSRGPGAQFKSDVVHYGPMWFYAATRRALGRAHVPPTKLFRRLAVNKTIEKPRVAAATGARRNKIPRCSAYDIRESNQKLISSSMSRHLSTRNISSKSMHAFLSNLANRQTDRRTNAGKRIYLLLCQR